MYHVESSLKTLALKFGNLSTNKANITIFITMLEGFRFTLDNEELVISLRLHLHFWNVVVAVGSLSLFAFSRGDNANIRVPLQKGKVAV